MQDDDQVLELAPGRQKYFPECVEKKGCRFQKVEDVFLAVDQEAKRRGIHSSYKLKPVSALFIAFRCSHEQCPAFFTFRWKNGYLTLLLSSIHHDHQLKVEVLKSTNALASSASIGVVDHAVRSSSAVQSEEIIAKSPLLVGQELSILPEDESDETSPDRQCRFLEEWAKKNNYSCKMNREHSQDRQSKLTAVFVSPTMRSTYLKYGDLLSFEMYNSLLEVSHESMELNTVGVFSVEDTNARPLVVGIALFSNSSCSSIYWAIENFILVQKIQPKSIFTGYRYPIEQAIRLLKKDKILQADHLISTKQVLDKHWSKLKESSIEVVGAVSDIKQAAITRDFYQYNRLIQDLQKRYASSSMITKLVKEYPQVLYCAHNSYVSIGKDSVESLTGFMNSHFKKKRDVIQFMDRIQVVVEQLGDGSARTHQRYTEFIDIQFQDPSLKDIVNLFESQVVERFVQNYVRGLREFVSIGQQISQNGRIFIVQSTAYKEEYLIKNWRCECQELERTGVACPHLLMLARVTSGKPYHELIDQRWKRNTKRIESQSI